MSKQISRFKKLYETAIQTFSVSELSAERLREVAKQIGMTEKDADNTFAFALQQNFKSSEQK